MSPSPIPFATLLAQLSDPDPLVRHQSIAAIMRRRQERAQAFASLLALLSDPRQRVRQAAIKALSQLGDPRALPALQALLSDPRQLARKAAIKALGQLGDSRALPALQALLSDPEESVRQAAVKALGQLGDSRVWPTLQALFSDHQQNIDLRVVVLRALVRLDQQQALPHLLTALQDPRILVRQAAVGQLRNLNDPRAAELLISALSDRNAALGYELSVFRAWAAEALGALGDARAVEPLRALLTDPHPDVIQKAGEVLAQLERRKQTMSEPLENSEGEPIS